MDAFNQQIYSCINVSCLLNANSFSTHYFANFHLIFSFCRNEFKRKQTGNETQKKFQTGNDVLSHYTVIHMWNLINGIYGQQHMACENQSNRTESSTFLFFS